MRKWKKIQEKQFFKKIDVKKLKTQVSKTVETKNLAKNETYLTGKHFQEDINIIETGPKNVLEDA